MLRFSVSQMLPTLFVLVLVGGCRTGGQQADIKSGPSVATAEGAAAWSLKCARSPGETDAVFASTSIKIEGASAADLNVVVASKKLDGTVKEKTWSTSAQV